MIPSLSAVLIIFFIMALFLAFKRSWTLNFIIWGMYLGIIFTPIFTIAGSFISKDITQDGWAGIGFLFLFIPLEIMAILMFTVGCIGSVKKKMNKKTQLDENPIDIR